MEYLLVLFVMVLYRCLGISVKNIIVLFISFSLKIIKIALVVVGGGDSASEEATFLSKYASKVYVLVRRDKLRASKVMADRLINHPKVEILWNTIPIEAKGDGDLLKTLRIKSTVGNGEEREINVDGLFYAIGHKPNTAFLKSSGLEMVVFLAFNLF